MNLSFSLYLAFKYLRPKRNFLTIVNVIAVLGVLLGVAVLIIVMSVMNGFDTMWREKILGFNAHVSVVAPEPMTQHEIIMQELEGLEGVTGVGPFIQSMVLVEFMGRVHAPYLRGIDAERESRMTNLQTHMKKGAFDLADGRVLLGADLARTLGARVGDVVSVHAPQSFGLIDEIRLPEEVTVSGIFEVGMVDFDMGFMLSSLQTARDLTGMEEGIHGLQVMTKDPFKAMDVAAAVRQKLGSAYQTFTWMDLNQQLFSALAVEKNLMFFILLIITVVAAFMIAAELITVTFQKTREIGLLKAVGFREFRVMRVFVWYGLVQGLFGTFLGVITGVMVLQYRNRLLQFLNDKFGLELFPKNLYHLSEIPAETSFNDVTLIVVSTLVVCVVASSLPALRAAYLDPVKALRYE